jgi:DNA-binding MarR family transcriptional regulator
VVRETDPRDSRVKRVVSTKKAVKIREKVSRAAQELLDQSYHGLDPAEIETVKRILEKVRRNLET